MNRSLLTLFALLASFALLSQPPAGKAAPGDNYGARIAPENAVPASSLAALLGKSDSTHVKVRAQITDVCSKKGCWLTFRVNDSTEAFVKMKDYGFFVPTALKGKTAVLEGVSFVKVTTVEELKHYAEDAKKPRAEIDAITAPKKEIRLIVDGITVVK